MDLKLFKGREDFFFARTRIYSSASVFVLACSIFSIANATADNSNLLDAQTTQQIQSIQNAQLQICLPAIEALGRSKNMAVVNPLADALSSEKRPVVRRYLVDALGTLRSRAALPTLKQALNDPDVQVRQSAVAAVGLLSSADVQTVLLEQAKQEKNRFVKRDKKLYVDGLLRN